MENSNLPPLEGDFTVTLPSQKGENLMKNETGNADYVFCEMNEELVKELENGGHLCFKGKKEQKAVLCSPSKTYAVKGFETSNTLLLMSRDPTNNSYNIQDILGSHFELIETIPPLHVLRELLAANPYEGETDMNTDFEDNTPKPTYSYAQLSEIVQASENQLLQCLDDMDAIEIDGCWRIIEQNLVHEIMDNIVSTVTSLDWSFDAVSPQAVASELAQYETKIVKKVLRMYVIEDDRKKISKDEQVVDLPVALDMNKLCVFFAQLLMKEAKREGRSSWNYDDFLEVWCNAVPLGAEPSIEVLRGHVLIGKASSGNQIVEEFELSSLHHDPTMRFRELLNKREVWLYEDILPYIKDLVQPGHSVEELLMKYTRSSQENPGEPTLYTKRDSAL